MVNTQQHLLDKERFSIKVMFKAGDTYTRIADVLGRGVSTISEEVKRNSGRAGHTAEKAHRRAYWRQLEKLVGATVYFCHPFHSWEKGLVKNTNRWIRQFIPKKADLA